MAKQQVSISPSGSQQQLYVRLFLRKHDWVRGSKLSYKSIASDLTPVSQSLVEKGFLLDSEDSSSIHYNNNIKYINLIPKYFVSYDFSYC